VVNMTKSRLGVLPCPDVGYMGSGATAVFGGTRTSWVSMHLPGDQSVHVRITALIPTAYIATSVSAPSERSP
jgi:hypothetical protein